MVRFGHKNGLLSALSVGPGYNDTLIRPWNQHNTRDREGGQYVNIRLGLELWLYLCSIVVMFHYYWCIRKPWPFSIVSYNITSIKHNQHTNNNPSFNP